MGKIIWICVGAVIVWAGTILLMHRIQTKKIKKLEDDYREKQRVQQKLREEYSVKVQNKQAKIAWYKNKIKEQKGTMEHLQEKAEDLERVKQYVGADKIQDIIDNVKEAERLQAEQKRLQRSYQNRMSR